MTGGELSGSKKALVYNKAELTIEDGQFRNASVAIINQGAGDSFVMEEVYFDTDEVSRYE